MLWEKLPDSLNERQKNDKVKNLLQFLKKTGIIVTESENKQTSYWILKENN